MEPVTDRPVPCATHTRAIAPSRAIVTRLHCREDDEAGGAAAAEAAATEP